MDELIEIDYKGIKLMNVLNVIGIWLDTGESESVSKLNKTGFDKLFSVLSDKYIYLKNDYKAKFKTHPFVIF